MGLVIGGDPAAVAAFVPRPGLHGFCVLLRPSTPNRCRNRRRSVGCPSYCRSIPDKRRFASAPSRGPRRQVTPKLYMDEHVHAAIVVELRARGVDVITAQEDGHVGNPDPTLLDRATLLGRLLVTYDVDFLREAALRAPEIRRHYLRQSKRDQHRRSAQRRGNHLQSGYGRGTGQYGPSSAALILHSIN